MGVQENRGSSIVDAEGATAVEAFLNVQSSQAIADGLAKVTNLFLEAYVEQYDFIFLVSDHDLDSSAAGRYATVTGPAMPGTGLDYDLENPGYKTNGRLRGIISINYNDYFGPLAHEMLHSWANFLDPEFGFGIGLDGDYGVHWGYTGLRGILGGFDAATLRCETPADSAPPNCTPESTGRYRYRVESFGKGGNSGPDDLFSPLELYLMGLIPRPEVPSPIAVLEEATEISGSFDPNTGTVAIEAAGVKSVDVTAIVTRHGLVRELPQDDRAFAAAFVVVSAMPATDAALDHIGDWAAIFGNRQAGEYLSFDALTAGRATLDTRLGPRRSVDDPPPAIRTPKNCDVNLQDCGAEKACYFFESGNTCGLVGDGIRDEPCTVQSECALGFWCSPNVDGTSQACEPYCSIDDQASDACVNLCDAWLLVDDAGVEVGAACRAP